MATLPSSAILIALFSTVEPAGAGEELDRGEAGAGVEADGGAFDGGSAVGNVEVHVEVEEGLTHFGGQGGVAGGTADAERVAV